MYAIRSYYDRRDVNALLTLIAGAVDCHPSMVVERPTWAHVGSMAHLRDRLMENSAALRFVTMADESLHKSCCIWNSAWYKNNCIFSSGEFTAAISWCKEVWRYHKPYNNRYRSDFRWPDTGSGAVAYRNHYDRWYSLLYGIHKPLDCSYCSNPDTVISSGCRIYCKKDVCHVKSYNFV